MPVPDPVLDAPVEYPIPLRLNAWMQVSSREASPTILTTTRSYYLCPNKDLPAQVRLTPILAIHLVPLLLPL
jgi:hypothetical protein